jgi:hypothetical protein
VLTLSALAAWLSSFAGGVVVKLVVDLVSNWLSQRQADSNAKAAGQAQATSKINKESADAERRASEVAVNRPDAGAVIAGMERGDTF